MNQPDRYSRFQLHDDQAKVEYHSDTKLKNAGHYVMRLEDHTVGNLLRQQLHADENVVFAGYRIPHPLDPLMVVRIQTTDAKLPQEAMLHALTDLKAEVSELKASLEMSIPRIDPAAPQHHQPQQYMEHPHDPYGQPGYAAGPPGGGYGGYGGGYGGGY